MNVQLLSHTPNAAALLIFTKNTRLEMGKSSFDELKTKVKTSAVWRDEQLAYMANTIPSSWEFVDYTFMVTGVTRAYTHQAVRNRTGSYAQQSMRVTDQAGFEYLTPDSLEPGTQEHEIYTSSMGIINSTYKSLKKLGIESEDARGVLPTNILTNIVVKYNLRTMSDIVKSRSGGRTQGEHIDVVKAMADEVIRVHPWAHMFLYPKGHDYFDDIEEATAAVTDPETRNNILKVIDKMRKDA